MPRRGRRAQASRRSARSPDGTTRSHRAPRRSSSRDCARAEPLKSAISVSIRFMRSEIAMMRPNSGFRVSSTAGRPRRRPVSPSGSSSSVSSGHDRRLGVGLAQQLFRHQFRCYGRNSSKAQSRCCGPARRAAMAPGAAGLRRGGRGSIHGLGLKQRLGGSELLIHTASLIRLVNLINVRKGYPVMKLISVRTSTGVDIDP